MTKRKTGARAPKMTAFAGELAKPIPYRLPARPSLAVLDLYPDAQAKWERERGAAMAEAAQETFRKLELLADHYGVTGPTLDSKALPLLLCVCRAFIPGFRLEIPEPSRRGRKKTRGRITTRMQLIADVQAIKAAKKLQSDRDALWALSQTDPRYRQYKKRGARVARDIDASGEQMLDALEALYNRAKGNGLQAFAQVVEQLCKAGNGEALAGLFEATENR